MTGRLSPKGALISGAAWTLAMRWSIKVIGFGNTLVMARLLMPSDYGLVAMAMLVVGLIQAFIDFGTTTSLLRRGAVSRDEIDSAWTLRLMEATGIAAIVAAIAWPAGMYFEETRVSAVLWVLSACIAINAFSNIGFTLAQKELNFALEFRFGVASKLLSVFVTILAGVWLGDYRALVCGIATGYIGGMVLSYVMHPYRPHWNTSRVVELWHDSKWLMFAGMAQFMLRKSDEIIASRIGNAQSFGLYNVGSDLGQLPTGEVGPAILKTFLPVLATIQSDLQRTNHAVIKTVAAVSTVTLPTGLVFAVLCEPATRLLLGQAWQGAAVFVACFSLVSTLQVMSSPLGTLLVLRGHVRVQSYVTWAEFGMFCLWAIVLVPHYSLLGLALARIFGTCGAVLVATLTARRLCGLSVRQFGMATCRPLVGAVLASLVAWQVMPWFNFALVQVLCAGLAASAVFIAWSAFSWLMAGRPEGLESTVFDYVVQRRAALAQV